jgi:hypothetical protein
MKIKYKLKEIYKGIFIVTIQDEYDLAMTFCRLQEFYESPFKQIRKNTFSMDEFQRMYAKKFGDGVFSYPMDWAGFNVPGDIVDEFMSVTFPDWGNNYDCIMNNIYWTITEEYETYNETRPYYLIGAGPKDKHTINHEICHALYYLDKNYKFRVNYVLAELNASLLEHFKSFLLVKGYSKNVLMDEINAYICFDEDYLMQDMQKMNKSEKKNFENIKHKLQSLFTSQLSLRKHLVK